MENPLVYATKVYPKTLTMSEVRQRYEEEFGYAPRDVFSSPSAWIAGKIDDSEWNIEEQKGGEESSEN